MGILHTVRGARPRLASPSLLVDGAGNTFIALTEYTNENAASGQVEVYKLDTSGRFTHIATRSLIEGKGDDCAIVQSGSDLLVFATVHVGDPRSDLQQLQSIQGVCVPYPNGHAPFGQGGAFLGDNNPTPDPIDYNRVQQIVHAEMQSLFTQIVQAFGGDIRAGIQAKAKDGALQAIAQAQVLSEGNVHDSVGLYNRIHETVFQTLQENGLIPPRP